MRRCAGGSDHTALSSSLDLAAFASRSAPSCSIRWFRCGSWRAAVPCRCVCPSSRTSLLCPTCPAYLSCPISVAFGHAPIVRPMRRLVKHFRGGISNAGPAHPLSGSAGPAVIGSGCGTLSAYSCADRNLPGHYASSSAFFCSASPSSPPCGSGWASSKPCS